MRVLRGRRLHAWIKRSGLPRGTYRVRIDATTSIGRQLIDIRTYHTCRRHYTRHKHRQPA